MRILCCLNRILPIDKTLTEEQKYNIQLLASALYSFLEHALSVD
jgi:hypothetical protein